MVAATKYPPGCRPVPIGRHVACKAHGAAIVNGECLGKSNGSRQRSAAQRMASVAKSPASADVGVGGSTPPSRTPMPGRHARGDAVCDALAESMRLAGIPSVEREFRFHPTRKWRFDIVARAHSLAVEVDGGAFTGGHSRGKAYEAECLKFAEAVILGWRVLRVTPTMVKSGQAIDLIRRAIGGANV